jgi:hypothetical protein
MVMTKTIREVVVTHLPHVSWWTGKRYITERYASIRVDVIFDDGSSRILAEYDTPENTQVSKKIANAQEYYKPAIGRTWREVRNLPNLFVRKTSAMRVTSSRWLHCGCGASVKMLNQTWKRFSNGEKVEISCEFCGSREIINPQTPSTLSGAG